MKRLSSENSRVYLNAKENEAKFLTAEKLAYSEDNKYVLVYSQEDVDALDFVYEAIAEGDRIMSPDIETPIYQNILNEGGINTISYCSNYKGFLVQEGDCILEFVDKIEGVTLYRLFNLEDAKSKGSEVEVVISKGLTKDNKVIGVIPVIEYSNESN